MSLVICKLLYVSLETIRTEQTLNRYFFRSERERPPRPPSDEKHHSEERSKRDRDHRDRRNKDHRHAKDEIGTGGWEDPPTEFHSYGPPQGFRGGALSKC